MRHITTHPLKHIIIVNTKTQKCCVHSESLGFKQSKDYKNPKIIYNPKSRLIHFTGGGRSKRRSKGSFLNSDSDSTDLESVILLYCKSSYLIIFILFFKLITNLT